MRPIDGTRQVGVFTKRIQQAVIDEDADIAVHSLKDLPTEGDERLALAAVPPRETVQDSLVSDPGWTMSDLPHAARVGTGSRRRGAQLLSHRADLRILPIRGNVQTRLEKLQSGEFDAIMLAEAGIVRLRLDGLSRSRLSMEEMLPAPGQGALGIEVRADDDRAREVVDCLNDAPTRAAVTAERRLLAELHGGCLAPIAALAQVKGGQIRMCSVVLSHDGKKRIDNEVEEEFDPSRWHDIAVKLASDAFSALKKRGAIELIEGQR